MAFNCILCNELLTESNKSDEHVIPNALGGRLKTKAATCNACNNRAGHGIDTKLVSALAWYANVLDLPRDAGEKPDVTLLDNHSRLNFVFKPGKPPIPAKNLNYSRDADGKGRLSGFAPSISEMLKVLDSAKPKGSQISNIDITESKSTYILYSIPIPGPDILDQDILRAIAKIALCYSRYANLPLSDSGVAIRYLRGESINPLPVVPIWMELISIQTTDDLSPLHHSIYLKTHSGRLFCYIALFGMFEFVVLLEENWQDCSATGSYPGYRYNLISCREEDVSYSWNDLPVEDWLISPIGPHERWKDMSKPFQYYYEHRDELWCRRGLAAAVERYNQGIAHGESPDIAKSAAQDEAQRVVKKHGGFLEINTIKVQM